MKKAMMKLTASISAVVMLCSLSAVFAATQPVSAAAEIVKEVTCIGTDAYYTIDADGHMVIYGSGEIQLRRPVEENITDEELQQYWQQQSEYDSFIRTNVTDLIISEGITNVIVSSSPFQSLQTVFLPDTLQVISSRLFFASQLQEVFIPASVTEIQYGAFHGCTSLQTVTFAEDSQLNAILEFAFWNAPLPNGVQLPASLQYIEPFAFKSELDEGRLFSLSSQTHLYSPCFTTGKDTLSFYETGDRQYIYRGSKGNLPFLQPYGDPDPLICGDVNLDSIVDLRDAILLNKFMAGKIILTADQLIVSDCDSDGIYSDDDIAALMQFLMLLEPSLPIPKK